MTTENSQFKLKTIVVGNLPKLGFPRKEIKFATSFNSSPTIYDFNIIFLRYSNTLFASTKNEKWEELRKFFTTGGILCIVGIDPTIERHALRLLGTSLPRLENREGEKIFWTRGTYLYEIMKEIEEGNWHSVVERSNEKGIMPFGRNKANEVVAFEVSAGRGKIVLLPDFSKRELEKIQRKLLIEFKAQIFRSSITSQQPSWFKSILLPVERKTKEELSKITNKLESIERAKRILFEEGTLLSKECAFILEEMLTAKGFEVKWKEEQGLHDIEIRNESRLIVIEVRASNGLISVDLPRQLSDHIQLANIPNKNIKGLIIGNPFRLTDPQSRKQSFTRECIDLAKRNSFCLMTTIQLLEWYNRIILGTSTVDAFIDSIYSTVGEMKQDAITWLS